MLSAFKKVFISCVAILVLYAIASLSGPMVVSRLSRLTAPTMGAGTKKSPSTSSSSSSSQASNSASLNMHKPKTISVIKFEKGKIREVTRSNPSSPSSSFSSSSSSSSSKMSKDNVNSENPSKADLDYYYNTQSKAFENGLRQMGLESADLHAFKSRYIITPHVYEDVNTNNNSTYDNGIITRKAPGKRKTKIISFHHIQSSKWVRDAEIFKMNRDFKRCPYSECHVDTEGVLADKADMVWFVCTSMRGKDLKKRPPGQLWAAACWESPAHYHYPNQEWRGVFNLTIGHVRGLDIDTIHSRMAWRNSQDLLKDEDYLAAAKKKTKTAAWFVSNCNAPSRRGEYVKEMQKYIDVDIYGKCGTMNCPRNNQDECLQKLNTTYKFYLSFENSLCKDYATYKFFGVFQPKHLHVVPVGRSGFDYDEHFPSDILVNAKNFKSAKELALYLKALGNDVERYAGMLKAKDRFVRLNYSFDWCDICEGLHTGKYKGRVIPDVHKETHYDGVCWTPKDIS